MDWGEIMTCAMKLSPLYIVIYNFLPYNSCSYFPFLPYNTYSFSYILCGKNHHYTPLTTIPFSVIAISISHSLLTFLPHFPLFCEPLFPSLFQQFSFSISFSPYPFFYFLRCDFNPPPFFSIFVFFIFFVWIQHDIQTTGFIITSKILGLLHSY